MSWMLGSREELDVVIHIGDLGRVRRIRVCWRWLPVLCHRHDPCDAMLLQERESSCPSLDEVFVWRRVGLELTCIPCQSVWLASWEPARSALCPRARAGSHVGSGGFVPVPCDDVGVLEDCPSKKYAFAFVAGETVSTED